jgi:31-O-methyltransferase
MNFGENPRPSPESNRSAFWQNRKRKETMRKTTLSNNHAVFCTNPAEVQVIYDQIEAYFRHGIQVEDGDVIFDIGANIGLFTLVVCEWGARALSVHAFEPIPVLFEALEANIAHYGLQDTVTPLAYGVSDQRGETVFTYYSRSTAFSTAYPAESISEEVRNHLHEHFVLPVWQRWVGRLSSRAEYALIDLRLRKKFAGQQVTCPTLSVSDAIKDYALGRIDLLKIDAEKAELSILRGINDPDWPKIRQIVLEVHNAEANLNVVKSMLSAHGFDNVVCEQVPDMESLNMVNVYARRGD